LQCFPWILNFFDKIEDNPTDINLQTIGTYKIFFFRKEKLIFESDDKTRVLGYHNGTIMEEVTNIPDIPEAKPKAKSKPILNRFVDFLSSVRFGVVLLVILVILSMVGMLIVQQNVNGFDAFYASLTPAEKYVYGVLGIFDIYHSWYYNFLLLVLSLNIILASIDRFPAAWRYYSHPKTEGTKAWLLHQKQNASLTLERSSSVEAVSAAFKKLGFKVKVSESEKDGRKHVYGERGRLNRLGAYIVHVFLLTLFLGHFVALQTGFDADVQLTPKQTTNQIELIRFNLDKQERYLANLPFTLTCTDIQQKLIDPKGSIEISNTMDWRTQIKIDDPQYGTTVADVSLNKPFHYRGYRFFQASAITIGAARTMQLEFTPEAGGAPINVELARDGEASLPDGTKIKYEQFWSDFVLGQPESETNEYNNPAVKLKVTTKEGVTEDAYAFAVQLPGSAPIGKPVGGYKIRLTDYEKSPSAHVLSIKYDPYEGHFIAWYIGGFGLMGALLFVFFVSHQRVWALIDGDSVTMGGNTNRNELGFSDRFGKIVKELEKK
jgi:cytochrome c biogenesis protein